MEVPFSLVRAARAGDPPAPAIRAGGRIVPLREAVARAGARAPAALRARADAAGWIPLLADGVDLAAQIGALLAALGPSAPFVEGAALELPLLPGKVIAAGRNYAAHAREMGGAPAEEPFFFGKLASCAVGPGAPIEIPSDLPGEVHHEAELAVVVGRAGRRIPAERALEWVAGYLCANDVTARTLQRRLQEKKLPWFEAKNADTFLALGPGIVPRAFVPDPAALRVRCFVDGRARQDAPTSAMIHTVASLLAHASRRVTLLPGDVLLTGTPEGVGPLVPGESVEVRIDGVGSLVNPVVAAPA